MINTRSLTSIGIVLLLAGSVTASPFAYVANSNGGDNSVSVIELATNRVVATVPVGEQPMEVAVNRAGTRAYVTNFNSGSVSVIDAESNSVMATITVGRTPFGVSVNPAGTRVYVANSYERSVSVIDAATNTVTATVAIPDGSSTVTVSPDGGEVYVAGTDGGCYGSVVSVIDAATNTVTATIPIAAGTCAVSAAPDGRHVYVATRAGVSVIDTATHNAATVALLPESPAGLALDPAGTRVFTANFGDGAGSTVSVIDAATGTVAATVDVDDRPLAVAVDPTGEHAYVVHNTSPGIVTVIDAVTGSATATVLVGNGPAMFGHEFIGQPPTAGGVSCANPRCVLEAVLSGPCGPETVPSVIQGKLMKALYLLDRSGIATDRKAAQWRKKASRVLAAADHLSRKAALQREPQLSIECSAALSSAISEVRTALRCRAAANPTLSDCGNTTTTTTPTTTTTSTTSPTVFRSCSSGSPSAGIVVLEQGGFVPAGLIGIDPATGDQCDFSSEGFLSNAIGANPNGVTLDPYGHQLLVVDRLGQLVAVDTATGEQALVTSGLAEPTAIAVESPGRFLITDYGGSLLRFDSTSQSLSVVASGGYIGGVAPWAIQMHQSGDVIVSALTAGGYDVPGPPSRVIRIDPTSGAQTLIAEITNGQFRDFALTESYAFIAISSRGYPAGADMVAKLDLATGQLSTLMNGLQRVLDVDFASDQSLLILDQLLSLPCCPPWVPVVYSASQDGSNQRIITQGGDMFAPARLVVLP